MCPLFEQQRGEAEYMTEAEVKKRTEGREAEALLLLLWGRRGVPHHPLCCSRSGQGGGKYRAGGV